jgi:hypothetical protein
MTIRPVLPGEHLSPDCGHHCGVRSAADEGQRTFIGHCDCGECRCPMAGELLLISSGHGVPMCDSWRMSP